MGKGLGIWLDGAKVARIEYQRGGPRLAYTALALDRHPLNAPLLSLSLPVRSTAFPPGVVRAFLDGLLPEGIAREALARDFSLEAGDTVGLVRALGRESAGALIILPDDESPSAPLVRTSVHELNRDDLQALISNLRSEPLGVTQLVRLSLAGVQEKLALVALGSNAWGQPAPGTPSTHIVKPALVAFPDSVANEAFCMRLARALGLDVARVTVEVIVGRPALFVERYDRKVVEDGSVARIHQEDFCQAFGLMPSRKYEEQGGPSLRRIAETLINFADASSLTRFLEALVCNVLIGNGDAHAKNFSLLRREGGGLTLAPLYDLLSTVRYGDARLAMSINGVQRIDRVTTAHVINEASTWGLSRDAARRIVEHTVEMVPSALAAASAETPEVPADLIGFVERQASMLRDGLSLE